ncbi:MAG: hypothetical protein FH753_11640 [Firmicutes bacterium]|nr:hypothetical protein [Bacillota bacterium]
MSEEEKNKEKILMKEEKIYKMWESIASKIESIHGGFNDYHAKALEAGATEEDINKFKKALDELTLAVDKKDDKLSLEKLNQMNFYMARFFDFYKGNIDAEILRIKYYTRKVHLDGMMNKWNEAEKNIEEITPIYERLDQKIKLEEKDKPLMDKLKFAIDDLENSIKYKSEKLLKIKRDIIIKNLDSIKDATK